MDSYSISLFNLHCCCNSSAVHSVGWGSFLIRVDFFFLDLGRGLGRGWFVGCGFGFRAIAARRQENRHFEHRIWPLGVSDS
jgi:hypothetical protein